MEFGINFGGNTGSLVFMVCVVFYRGEKSDKLTQKLAVVSIVVLFPLNYCVMT